MTYTSLIRVLITTLFESENYTVDSAISFIHGTAIRAFSDQSEHLASIICIKLFSVTIKTFVSAVRQ